MTKYLNRKYNWTIRWDGYDTQRINHWVALGNTYEEIWDATVLADVNHLDFEFEYRANKVGADCEMDEDEIWSVVLDDDDYKTMLLKSKGNAYYSEFTTDEEE